MTDDQTEFVHAPDEGGFKAPEDALIAQVQENARKAWVKRWYAQDFSWHGLANKPWFAPDSDTDESSVERSLQDYWRVPTVEDIEALQKLIKEKAFSVEFPKGCKTKTQQRDHLMTQALSDEALQALSLLLTINGRVWHVAHAPIFDPEGGRLSIDTLNTPWFEPAGQKSLFEQRATLSQPQSPRHWPGTDETSPESLAQFMGCQFRKIEEKVSPEVHDGDEPKEPMTFGANMDWVLFQEEVRWTGIEFLAGTSFQEACFLTDAHFTRSRFNETSFMESVFLDEATFTDTIFVGDGFFDGMFVVGYTSFIDATFEGTASFDSVKICGAVQFDGAFFQGTVLFSDGLFVEDFSFEAVAAPLVESTDKRRMLLQTLFKDTVFLSDASFQNRLFTEQVDFSRASFYGRAQFYNCTFHPNVTFTPSRFHLLSKKTDVTFDLQADPSNPIKEPTRINIADCPAGMQALIENKRRQTLGSTERSGWFEDREQDLRNLKDHMGKLSANTERQDFHALEIAARMRRQSGVTAFEKTIGAFYKFASDYGRNPFRPLIGIALIFVFSVFGTGIMADRLDQGDDTPCLFVWSDANCQFSILPVSGSKEARIWKEVLSQNAQRTVFPVFRIKSEFETSARVESTYPLLATGLILLQTGLSIVLIFLFLLTIKRRFQMS